MKLRIARKILRSDRRCRLSTLHNALRRALQRLRLESEVIIDVLRYTDVPWDSDTANYFYAALFLERDGYYAITLGGVRTLFIRNRQEALNV